VYYNSSYNQKGHCVEVTKCSYANEYRRKIKINLRTKVEIFISTYTNAVVVCYSATWRTELNYAGLIIGRS